MLISAANLSKSIGHKTLFDDLSFTLTDGSKIALIGRNGNGKTTLLNILGGEDAAYGGTITSRKGLRITVTKQEHAQAGEVTALDYVLASVPHFYEYTKVLEDYEQGRSTNLTRYLKVLEYYTQHRYSNIKDAITSTLQDFGIAPGAIDLPIAQLSGGQKRYVEMTRMMFSQSDLLLVDEPTNHMDYLGKQRFINWMNALPQAVIIVTHDRDVLRNVHKIIELKEQKIDIFKGNYDSYISQNANHTLASVKLYSDQLNRLKEAKKKVDWGLQMRAKSKAWKIRYDHWLRDYEKIKAATVKPSFWIDQDSVDALDKKVLDSYHKFKEKNIHITTSTNVQHGAQLVQVKNVALGYDNPVFEGVSFTLGATDRVFIKGKNGAGKSTLVKTIVSLAKDQVPEALLLDGEITIDPDIRIGEYEQEINARYLSMSLEEAILRAHEDKKVPITIEKVKRLLAQYLFDPKQDGHQKIGNLSGGQKARFQLIKLFAGDPNVLILDEPTNHLDLPSIEELENALEKYAGGIVYITHDTYFVSKMGGAVVQI